MTAEQTEKFNKIIELYDVNGYAKDQLEDLITEIEDYNFNQGREFGESGYEHN